MARLALQAILTLAKGTQIGAQAGINFNITEENKQWHGSPAQPLRNWMRASVIFKHLPDVEKRINALEEELKKLTAELEKNTLHNEPLDKKRLNKKYQHLVLVYTQALMLL